ncbi:MAG: hypothetical protein LBB51_04015, partial [Zoogloeaceae bacterium]|nr:hypothetical protein [Zoogloeaceae bacterium]
STDEYIQPTEICLETDDLEYLNPGDAVEEMIRKMVCVGRIAGYDYIAHGEDEVWLFADEREAVLYFNWT